MYSHTSRATGECITDRSNQLDRHILAPKAPAHSQWDDAEAGSTKNSQRTPCRRSSESAFVSTCEQRQRPILKHVLLNRNMIALKDIDRLRAEFGLQSLPKSKCTSW